MCSSQWLDDLLYLTKPEPSFCRKFTCTDLGEIQKIPKALNVGQEEHAFHLLRHHIADGDRDFVYSPMDIFHLRIIFGHGTHLPKTFSSGVVFFGNLPSKYEARPSDLAAFDYTKWPNWYH